MTNPRMNWEVCPNCGNDEIEGDAVEIGQVGGEETANASQDLHCLTEGCNTTWTEVYTASYRTNIQQWKDGE